MVWLCKDASRYESLELYNLIESYIDIAEIAIPIDIIKAPIIFVFDGLSLANSFVVICDSTGVNAVTCVVAETPILFIEYMNRYIPIPHPRIPVIVARNINGFNELFQVYLQK